MRIMCAKATATIASYRSTPVPSTQREEFSFLSFLFYGVWIWREDNNCVVSAKIGYGLFCGLFYRIKNLITKGTGGDILLDDQ